jgi:hypothetical protein
MPLSNQATNALGWALLAIFAVLWWGAKGTLGQQLDRIVSSIHIVSRAPLKGPDPKGCDGRSITSPRNFSVSGGGLLPVAAISRS